MESYQILLEKETIEYDVIYMQRQSLVLKVEKGRLLIKAPVYTSKRMIEENIRRYQKKLLSQIKDYVPYYDYRDCGYVYIMNIKYDICLRDVSKKQCAVHDHFLYVYHSRIDQCVERYLKKRLLDYIEERVISYLAYDFDLGMPKIEVRKYKGRWGSCFYKENKISFNLSLIHLDKELIDYVIVHELTHFLQANHSSMFYQEMQKRMPDYKLRQKRLKEKHV